MPEEEGDVEGFVEGVAEESSFLRRPREAGVGGVAIDPLTMPVEGPAPPSETVKAGVNPDHVAGVIVEVDGKQVYAPMYTPDPDAEKGRRRLQIRTMEEFGDAELEQIINHPGAISLFAADLPESSPPAFQISSEDMRKHQIIIVQGGMAWEQDPGWKRFFRRFDGEPGFSRGGGYPDSEGNLIPSKFLLDKALTGVRAIIKRYSS